MFKLPYLQYSFDALEPHIDTRTMEIHHDRHHNAYVNGLNKALEGEEELLDLDIEDLLTKIDKVPEKIRQSVINHGGGHANHSLFWSIMSPEGGGEPKGDFARAIEKKFGDFKSFQKSFLEKAVGVFGSGWVFLIVGEGKLKIKRHSFQNSPLMNGNTPILSLDVWEHAYYLKYQNKRAEYVNAWWNVVNWNRVDKNYKDAV